MSLWRSLSACKPAHMRAWLFWGLLAVAALLALGLAVVGLWVLFTQIEFM